jgi:hypothetical protein
MKRTLFALLVVVSLTVVLIPAYIIRPFRGQSAEALTLAITLRTWAPLATVLTGIAALLLAVGLLRGARWPQKALVALGALLVVASAALARYNYFERVFFRPITTPQFESIAQTKLDPDERVLAVRSGAQTRAYPIRAMAYHHLVNDTLGGVPLVATY